MKWTFNILSHVYGCVVFCKSWLYKYKLLKSYAFGVPVISVGNITSGGTGKTPMVLWLANQLIQKNKNVCVVTRGYKRKSKNLIVIGENRGDYNVDQIGDEPLMIIKRNPAVQMVVGHDKVKAINEAINSLDIDVIIVDDGPILPKF